MKGITLFEMLLVLAIASAIIVMAIAQYPSYKNVSDTERLQATIDNIFLATANYYRANCKPSTTSALWTLSGGKLVPTSVTVDIKNMLVTKGFLDPLLPNGMISQAGNDPYDGYTVLINMTYQDAAYTQLLQKYQCTTSSGGVCTNNVAVGTVALAQIYVAVCLKTSQYMNQVIAMMNPDSTSACSGGQLLRFFRMPSSVIAQSSSDTGNSMRASQQVFAEMYTTAPLSYLLGTSGAANKQYYYCGS